MAETCENCKYRLFLANAYDIHIDDKDCDKVNTHFCEKMRKPDTVVIIDAGCTDKTIYRKGYKDGKADAIPTIVPCKDCKKATRSSTRLDMVWCNKFGNIMGECDFCSYGERRTEA